MNCQSCHSENIFQVNAKCDDRCTVKTPDDTIDDYVPYNANIGGGDYIKFSVCADCGQMQGTWPIDINEIE